MKKNIPTIFLGATLSLAMCTFGSKAFAQGAGGGAGGAYGGVGGSASGSAGGTSMGAGGNMGASSSAPVVVRCRSRRL